MAGNAILELEKSAQERLLRLGEKAHVHRALPAAQNRAHRYRQNLMKVVQRGIAGARVVQSVPAFDKAIQDLSPAPQIIRDPVKSISPNIAKSDQGGRRIPSAIPLGEWRKARASDEGEFGVRLSKSVQAEGSQRKANGEMPV